MLTVRNHRELWQADLTQTKYLLDDYVVPYRLISLAFKILNSGAGIIVPILELLDPTGDVLMRMTGHIEDGNSAAAGSTIWVQADTCRLLGIAPRNLGIELQMHIQLPDNMVVLDNQRLSLRFQNATVPGSGGTTTAGDIHVGVVVDL